MGFFLWFFVEDGEIVVLKFWKEMGVCVLFGVYLSKDVNGENFGKLYIWVVFVVLKNDVIVVLKIICVCLFV